MIHGVLMLAGFGLAAVGMAAAQSDVAHSGAVTTLAALDIMEKVNGKETRATAVEVMLEAGQAWAPHRHPGSVRG